MVAGRPPQLQPESQYPVGAIAGTVQEYPKEPTSQGAYTFTWNIASAADIITPWGRSVYRRDKELRDFWPTEPYLAGAMANVAFRNSVFEWEIRGPARVTQVITDMLGSALAGDSFGWVPFLQKYSQDLYTTDNGAFIELIRDEGMDANSRFKGPLAPVLGIAHLDSNRCVRTGKPDIPVVYTDRQSAQHKLYWYQVIPYSDYPSAIETMNGVGYCAVTRILKMAQIARSIALYKDEKISGRQYKQIHFVSGVSRQDIKDEMTRGQEEANNSGMIRFIMPAILASLDPERPVSTATIDLASLPDGFDYDQEMKWYISCLALGFGVDYQEFAPLPGGNIGSSQQSMILHRKGSGKGPAVLMRSLADSFRNYGILPKGCSMRFNDKDEQEELERQTVRTKAMEEMAIAINSHALTPKAAADSMVRRGIWEAEDIAEIPEEFYAQFESHPKPVGQPVGNKGGNTIVEDAGRQNTGKTSQTAGNRLQKEWENFLSRFRKDTTVDPKITVNVPPSPAPEVRVMVPRQSGQLQKIERDLLGNIASTTTKYTYDGYVVSNSGNGKEPDATPAGVSRTEGEIVINTPAVPRQVVNIRMPKVSEEKQTVVRDAHGNIDHTVKQVTYEE